MGKFSNPYILETTSWSIGQLWTECIYSSVVKFFSGHSLIVTVSLYDFLRFSLFLTSAKHCYYWKQTNNINPYIQYINIFVEVWHVSTREGVVLWCYVMCSSWIARMEFFMRHHGNFCCRKSRSTIATMGVGSTVYKLLRSAYTVVCLRQKENMDSIMAVSRFDKKWSDKNLKVKPTAENL